MANQRSAGQVLIGFWADKLFVDKIDSARGEIPRSGFLREVLKNYLEQRGYVLTSAMTSAPDRAGKGGPTRYPAHSNESMLAEEAFDAPPKSRKPIKS